LRTKAAQSRRGFFPEISWGALPVDRWTCPAFGANLPIDIQWDAQVGPSFIVTDCVE
jgi:hypothetical protein